MRIKRITDNSFKKYGKIIDLDTEEIIEAAKQIKYPKNGTEYVASVKEFEKLKIAEKIKDMCFGGLDTQIGYCCGKNNIMSALEWHTCSEVDIAAEDLILLLGDVKDIDDNNHYDSSKVEVFRLNKGEAVEIYATTLHYCPLSAKDSGFLSIVGLLRGTNTEIDFRIYDKLIFGKNKWLICHSESKELVDNGAFVGIDGENLKLD